MAARAKRRGVVTGACGFLGSHMVETLARAGHEVVATDSRTAVEDVSGVGKVCVDVTRRLADRLVVSDPLSPGALDDVVAGADWVFHLASETRGAVSWASLYRMNVQATSLLIDSVVRTAPALKRLVLCSDGGVYGRPRAGQAVFCEDMDPNPVEDVQKSRWFQEFLTTERCNDEGIKWSLIRPAQVIGTRRPSMLGGLAGAVSRLGVYALPSNFNRNLPLVCAEDVCGAALHLAKYHSGIGGRFNVCGDAPVALEDVLRTMARAADKPFVKLPPLPMEAVRSVSGAAAALENTLSRMLGGAGRMDPGAVQVMGREFGYSNRRLKEAGYELQYPEPGSHLEELAAWYVEHGLA